MTPSSPEIQPLARSDDGKLTFPYQAGSPVRITSPYTENRWGKPHNGVDMTSPSGKVATIQGGVVVYTGAAGNAGNTVIVKTPDGLFEQFSHLRDVRVKVGHHVAPGTLVGMEGNTGVGTGPHLHFQVWTAPPILSDGSVNSKVWGNRYVQFANTMNPIDYMSRVRTNSMRQNWVQIV